MIFAQHYILTMKLFINSPYPNTQSHKYTFISKHKLLKQSLYDDIQLYI